VCVCVCVSVYYNNICICTRVRRAYKPPEHARRMCNKICVRVTYNIICVSSAGPARRGYIIIVRPANFPANIHVRRGKARVDVQEQRKNKTTRDVRAAGITLARAVSFSTASATATVTVLRDHHCRRRRRHAAVLHFYGRLARVQPPPPRINICSVLLHACAFYLFLL